MSTNLFDNLDQTAANPSGGVCWAARAPFRPQPEFDLMLLPRVPEWRADEESQHALERIEAATWVDSVDRGDQVQLRLREEWIEAAGAALEAGEGPAALGDLATGGPYAVYFWGANTTKALHVGHLRNLAIGNAIGAALTQAGARVEHRSLICDVGRSMGEAMAGVVERGGPSELAPGGDEKSDHFVGACYAEYVTAGRDAGGDDGAEDSVARESSIYDDRADELMMRVLAGDQPALELWSRTRTWVIAGQRRTLARLGIPFDKVIFESDFLPEVRELTDQGLAQGILTRRYGDQMVIYETGREELEEMPLVRADGLPTQHMRALAYWSAAPELDDVISLQVCGNEWVSHVTCRRQLIDALEATNGDGKAGVRGGGPPTHDVFHGMVARDHHSISSSKEGALLVDDLGDWIEAEIESRPERASVRQGHPGGERLAAQVALAYFLLQPASKQVDFEPAMLLREEGASLGWDLARARAQRAAAPASAAGAADPEYRFAVVQAQMYRRHLRAVVDGLDVAPLARYLSHFARWYLRAERSPRVGAIVHAVLDQGVAGLGLGGSR